ncbi:MAG: ribulose-phosphate 3-epimerase [Ruminococcaceae bacterium]|nr:ribulose-phosphate 3-epimerase [Oscillospiraceae bacterium]
MIMKTAPSILAADMLKVGEEMIRAEKAGAHMLHADVMDGVYVPNISFGFDFIKAVRSVSSLTIDAHMMTVCPGKYIKELKAAGADIVTVHHDIGTADEVKKILSDIRGAGMKAALALRPKFPASDIEEFLPYIDMALVMTVEPGFGGQSFMADMLPKIREIRKMAPSLDIQVDGGINAETAALCAEAGANIFVVGTASFRAPDMKAALDGIIEAVKEYEVK